MHQQDDIPLSVGEIIADEKDIQTVWWNTNNNSDKANDASKSYSNNDNHNAAVLTFQRPDQWQKA